MSLGNLVIEKSCPAASKAQRLKGRIAQNFSATFFDQMGSQCRSVRLTDSPHQPLQVSSLYSHPPKIVCNTKTISFCISKRSSQFDNGMEMFFCSSTYTLVQSEINQLNFSQFSSFSGFTLRWRWLWGGSGEFLSRGKLISITLGSPDLYYSCYEDNEDNEEDDHDNQDDYHIDRDSRDHLKSWIIILGSMLELNPFIC